MNTRNLLTGVGLGAGLAFMLDPNGAARRRARVRDKMAKTTRVTRDTVGSASRDLSNRPRGVAAAAQACLSDEPPADEVLVDHRGKGARRTEP